MNEAALRTSELKILRPLISKLEELAGVTVQSVLLARREEKRKDLHAAFHGSRIQAVDYIRQWHRRSSHSLVFHQSFRLFRIQDRLRDNP